jgi:protein-L-isoaspartate(D-aspartate) O-methyltransferase
MMPAEIRNRYAEDLRSTVKLRSEALVQAFARVPREHFVGKAPWRLLARMPGQMQPQILDTTDPKDLYSDVAVYLDPSKNLTNGNPSTLATWLDALDLSDGMRVFHLGCGAGYYTAILAEVVGPSGHVLAAEVEPALATEARVALSRYSHVDVVEDDGGSLEIGMRDAILVNAGVTHVADVWLNSLTVGGTLIAPITVEFGNTGVGKGLALRVRREASGYSAQFLPAPVMIYSCTSVRTPQMATAFAEAMRTGAFREVRSLRRDQHTPDATCWMHSGSFCLSIRAPA